MELKGYTTSTKLKKLKRVPLKAQIKTKGKVKVYPVGQGKQRLFTTWINDNIKLMMINSDRISSTGTRDGEEPVTPPRRAEQEIETKEREQETGQERVEP